MDFIRTGNVLHKLVHTIAGEEYKDFVSIVFGWKRIVGELLAERATIHKIEKNVLFVSVSNNVWMQELVLRKFQLMSDIQSVLGIELKDIVFFLKDGNIKRKKRRKKNG